MDYIEKYNSENRRMIVATHVDGPNHPGYGSGVSWGRVGETGVFGPTGETGRFSRCGNIGEKGPTGYAGAHWTSTPSGPSWKIDIPDNSKPKSPKKWLDRLAMGVKKGIKYIFGDI